MSKEVRITSETGGEKGQKDERFGGGDPLAMMELARVYGMGEQKYARYNYLKGYPWSLSVDALFRHLFAFLSGEDRDPESGLLHTAHVAWHANTLSSFQLRKIGTDDRAPIAIEEAPVPPVLPSEIHDPVYFLCGHRYGEEPITDPTIGPLCGTSIHWTRVNGIEARHDEILRARS